MAKISTSKDKTKPKPNNGLPKRTRLVKSDKYYISNKDFSNEIIACKVTGVLTPKAVDFFILLSNRTIRTKKLHHRCQADIEDAVQTAIEDCLRYWQNFDPTVSEYGPNAFSYFTSIVGNGFAKFYNKMYKLKGVDGHIKHISLNTSGDEGEIYSL